MNFDEMPEFGWRYGYFGALAFMALVGGLLALLFRKLKWW
jgi:magnesium transporter